MPSPARVLPGPGLGVMGEGKLQRLALLGLLMMEGEQVFFLHDYLDFNLNLFPTIEKQKNFQIKMKHLFPFWKYDFKTSTNDVIFFCCCSYSIFFSTYDVIFIYI